MAIQKIILGPYNDPASAVINIDTITGAITEGDNSVLNSRLNLTTGLVEFRDQNGIILHSFNLPNDARGGASKVVRLPDLTVAMLNSIVGPTASFTFAGVLPADFMLAGIVAIAGAAPLSNVNPIVPNMNVGIREYAATDVFGGFVNGKAVTAPTGIAGSIGKVDVNIAGGQQKNLAAIDAILRVDIVDLAGAPAANVAVWAGSSVQLYALGASFGTATGYAG